MSLKTGGVSRNEVEVFNGQKNESIRYAMELMLYKHPKLKDNCTIIIIENTYQCYVVVTTASDKLLTILDIFIIELNV